MHDPEVITAAPEEIRALEPVVHDKISFCGIDIYPDQEGSDSLQELRALYVQTVGHIARGERIIARQRNLLEKLRGANCETQHADRLLETFLAVHETQVAHLARLQKTLGDPAPGLA